MLNKHILIIAALWVVLTAAGVVAVLSFDPFPVAASEEAGIVDGAFRILAVLSVPVFTFVVVALIYSTLRFRTKGEPVADGPPVRTHRPFIAAWFVITTGLTATMIIHPGYTGLTELRDLSDEEPDLVVMAEARQWAWRVTYPAQQVFSRTELVLPLGAHTRFDVTSVDVLHAFWIPAFRIKIDSVPGLLTQTYATPNALGDFDMDAGFRLQCAELCGLGHAVMAIPVRVVSQGEFDAWIAEQSPIR
jgi:cytochrome c oxidase subunit 2